MTPPRYGPPDASLAPRYTGVRPCARGPHLRALDGVAAAVGGVPCATATSFRSGPRFGPEAIASEEALGFPEHRVRVVAPDVGGGFGVKGSLYPEEVLIPFLARLLD